MGIGKAGCSRLSTSAYRYELANNINEVRGFVPVAAGCRRLPPVDRCLQCALVETGQTEARKTNNYRKERKTYRWFVCSCSLVSCAGCEPERRSRQIAWRAATSRANPWRATLGSATRTSSSLNKSRDTRRHPGLRRNQEENRGPRDQQVKGRNHTRRRRLERRWLRYF